MLGKFVPYSSYNWPLATSAPRLRIASLNVHRGKRLGHVIDEFHTPQFSACDVILLQEVEEHFQINQAEFLAARFGYHYHYLAARPTRQGTHGIAILSKHPLSDIENLLLPRNESFINTRDRVALGATITVGDRPVRIYNVHLDTKISVPSRQRQLVPVISAANFHQNIPTIIAGDFNTFNSHHTRHLDALLTGAGFSSPFLYGSHYTAKFLFWRPQLDWIYARHLQIVDAKVKQESRCSDHRPLWVDILVD